MEQTRLDEILESQLNRTLMGTDLPDLGKRYLGKVRDSYVDGGSRAVVVTDRLSAFDVVIGTVPFKGQVRNQIGQYWFEQTAEIAPNHLVSVPDPNVMMVRECRPLPMKLIVRAYLTGSTRTSMWGAYERGEREFCGHTLPDAMRKNDQLPQPLATPATRSPSGARGEALSREQLVSTGAVSAEQYDQAAEMVTALFAFGQERAAGRGLILVDGTYELGISLGGDMVVIGEIHTPDVARYWHAKNYEARHASGEEPLGLDADYVHRWLVEDMGFRGTSEPPDLPDDVRMEAARRYIATYELLTGQAFEPDTDEPQSRIARNLGCI